MCSMKISEDFLGEASLAPDQLLSDARLQVLAKSWYSIHLFPMLLLDLKHKPPPTMEKNQHKTPTKSQTTVKPHIIPKTPSQKIL